MIELSKRQKIRLEVNSLKDARVSYEAHWREIADYFLPYRLRLQLSDFNRGDRKNTRIYDSTALAAVETLESGVMAEAMDQSSKWIRFTTKDPERSEFGPHREWLDRLGDLALGIMDGSNVYVTTPTVIGNMAGFGTGAMSLEEVFNGQVIYTEPLETGTYWTAQDEYGAVNAMYSEYRMTIRQLYAKFGREAELSTRAQQMIDKSDWEQWVDVGHLVYPNEDYDQARPSAKHKQFASCWFEIGSYSTGAAPIEDKFLREGGFDSFPYMVGRWEKAAREVWGIDCPAMKCIGDNKGLQVLQKRVAQMVEKGANPHWLAPAGLRGTLDHGFLPGETSYVSEQNEGKSVRPAHMVDPAWIGPATEREDEFRKRINGHFHVDTFQMLRTLPDKTRTATEVMQRKAEGLKRLVKMYANFQRDIQRPMIDRIVEVVFKQNLIEPPPPDLWGHELKYEYQGELAQAQKMSSVEPIERVIGDFVELAKIRPDLWDKFNLDQMVDEVATRLGVPATCINSDEVTASIRQQRQKALEAQQKVAMMEQASKAAKNLAQSPMDGENALTKLVGASA
jgi:hypothetical protein